MTAQVSIDRSQVARLCRRYHIRKLALFGSVLSDSFSPTSDVDVLVEFEPDQGPGLMGMVEMEDELSRMLGGHKVDLVTAQGLSRYIRDRVLAEAEIYYAA